MGITSMMEEQPDIGEEGEWFTSMMEEQLYMAVVDIKSAYRALSIFPEHRSLLGLRWELDNTKIYVEDGRMCFGLRVGPMQFNKVSEYIQNFIRPIWY